MRRFGGLSAVPPDRRALRSDSKISIASPEAPTHTRIMESSLRTGVAAALTAAVLASGWQLLTRYGVTTTLAPIEIALLRYGIPALVLMPVLLRVGLRPAHLSRCNLAVLVAGGGLPFGLLVVTGAQFAPAAHIGVFMAGTMPVFTALADLFLLREPISPLRCLSFVCILAGVAWLGLSGNDLSRGAWRGDLLFLLAATAWAGHTVVFRNSRLTPWEGAAVVNTWSLLGLAVLLPLTGARRLFTAPWADVALQAFGQGVLAGLLGIVSYMTAVAHLGSTKAALSSALVPSFTVLGAGVLLGEPVDPSTWCASALVTCGIALATGAAWPKSWRKPAVGP